jgi:hypothetical protein
LGGNGILGQIFVDGVSLWSQFIEPRNETGVNYALTTSVKKGSFVDFVIDPFNNNDRVDSTQFTATIATEVVEAKTVPEPSSLLGSLTFWILGTKRLGKRKKAKI